MKKNVRSDKNSRPFVSVIIPAYNEEKNIGRCLESIKNQNYPEEKIEIIVVDDGSTDQSVNIARKHGVKVLRQKNKGPGVARNKGVYEASGDIVAFIDADDVAKRSWLRDLIPSIRENSIAAAKPYENILNKEGVLSSLVWFETRLRYINLPDKTNHIGTSGSIFKKDIFLDVGGFNPKLLAAEDMDIANKITKKGYEIVLLRKPLIKIRYPNSIVEYSLSQIKKSAYMVYSYLTSERASKKSSSYTNLKDPLQAVMPFLFFSLAVLSPNIMLIILFGILLFLSLICINVSYIQFVFQNRDKEKLSRFWPVALQFYLVVRALVWSVGLLYGFYLTISDKLRSPASNIEVWK